MDSNDWVQKEKEWLEEDIESFQKEVNSLIEDNNFRALIDREIFSSEDVEKLKHRVGSACEGIKDAVKNLTEPNQDEKEKRHYAFAALSSVAVLDAEITRVASLMQGIRQVGTHIAGKAKNIWNRLVNCVKGISAHLWHLISHLMTPKSWTVHGDVGAGAGLAGLFGLKGTVGLSITFGS